MTLKINLMKFANKIFGASVIGIAVDIPKQNVAGIPSLSIKEISKNLTNNFHRNYRQESQKNQRSSKCQRNCRRNIEISI